MPPESYQACIDHADQILCIRVWTMERVFDDCLAKFSNKYVEAVWEDILQQTRDSEWHF